jgi:ADP-ribose pyrophosphatase
VKKHLLTYELPDGQLYEYHCATRRNAEDFREELERNAKVSERVMQAIHAGEQPPSVPAFTPDAVCIVARTPRDTLVMEREFRYPLNSWCIAFPAGLVDPGEDIITCAIRELEEETGYTAVEGTMPRALPQVGYSSTGLTDETVQIVFVEAERAGDARLEHSELIEMFELPIADIRNFLDTNQLPIGTRAQLILEMYAFEHSLV